jgi:hypothetical protein
MLVRALSKPFLVLLLLFSFKFVLAQDGSNKQKSHPDSAGAPLSARRFDFANDSIKNGLKLYSSKLSVKEIDTFIKSGEKFSTSSLKIKPNTRDSGYTWKKIQTRLAHWDSVVQKSPFVIFNGGEVNYNFFYRSILDTPFAATNYLQHQSGGNFNFTISKMFPLRVSYLLRIDNSPFFKNIHDVRVEFDPVGFRKLVSEDAKKKLEANLERYKDSSLEHIYENKLAQVRNLKKWLEDPFTNQRLYEMNEIVLMPSITYDRSLPDSIAKGRSDSIRSVSKFFLEQYNSKKVLYDSLQNEVDSLKTLVQRTKNRIETIKYLVSHGGADLNAYKNLTTGLNEVAKEEVHIPKKYEWLLGIRNMSIGKTQLNHSELTTKYASLNGINFEYNRWYYFAFSAGLIDYNYRDFSFQSLNKNQQYLYMLRLGLGQIERNFFILSYFSGQKQLYNATQVGKGPQAINISGTTVEGKIQFAKSSYIIAEAGQSFAPAMKLDTSKIAFWNLADNRNKAISIKLYSFVPWTQSRIEGQYKYIGANYQSFSSFQPNASFNSWYVKLDQSLFKRSLKIVGSLKSNEFSNPYVIQNYSSTSIFKSLSITYRKRKLPSITIGYIPASQFVRLENSLLESRFQTLNVNINHIYKIGNKQASTSIVFSKFFNHATDSAYTYYNAVNWVVAQNFFLKSFNASLSIIQTSNSTYKLDVLDGNLQIPISSRVTVGMGSKVNSLNREQVRIGFYGNTQFRFSGSELGFVSFEKGYLPGISNGLKSNDFLNVGITKYFK